MKIPRMFSAAKQVVRKGIIRKWLGLQSWRALLLLRGHPTITKEVKREAKSLVMTVVAR